MNTRTIKFSEQLVPTQALIVYEKSDENGSSDSGDSGINFYISRHRIGQKGELLEGTPLTRQTLLEIAALVLPGLQTTAYIPEKLICYVPDYVTIWWTPAAIKKLFFSKVTGIKSGMYPVPATLFMVLDGTLHTWALAKSRRPLPDTAAYNSPFNNVHPGGACCMGNIALPQTFSPDDISLWENCFFNGVLNNDLPPKLKNKMSAQDLWTPLSGKKKFPVSCLTKSGDVAEIIKSIQR